MRTAKGLLTTLMAAGFVLSICAGVQAQDRGGREINPSPGNMVNEGMARARAAVRNPFATTQVTEQADTTPSFRELFETGAMQVLVDQVSQLLDFFVNRLFARAGLPPLFPTVPVASSTGTEGTSDATSTVGTVPGGDAGSTDSGSTDRGGRGRKQSF